MPFADMLSYAGGLPPLDLQIQTEKGTIPVVIFDPHAVEQGWASWPFNFDPIWLRFCYIWETLRVDISRVVSEQGELKCQE